MHFGVIDTEEKLLFDQFSIREKSLLCGLVSACSTVNIWRMCSTEYKLLKLDEGKRTIHCLASSFSTLKTISRPGLLVAPIHTSSLDLDTL